MKKLLKILHVSRPVSWINTAYPFAAGYLVLGGGIDLLFIVSSLFFLIPYNILMYGVNDVFDYESDINNPRKGSIEGAVESRAFHPTIIKASIYSTVPFVALIVLLTSWQNWLALAAVLFFVVAYSIKRLRFKEIPVLDSITSSIHFVGPLVFAASLFGFPSYVCPFITAFFLWGIASHAFGAVQDIIPDRLGKLHSIATVFGARITVWFSFLAYLAAALIIANQGGWGVAVALAGLLYTLNVVPFLGATDKTSERTNRGWRRFIWVNYAVGAVVTIALILGN